VFLPGGEPGFSFSNPYLIAATVAALVAWKLKNVLLTAVISMTVFFLLSYIP